jgi:hypothetical protein
MSKESVVFTVCDASDADHSEARDLLEELAASDNGIDTATRLWPS